MQKLKICFISREFPENCGGIGTYVYETARELSKKAHDITIVTAKNEQLKRLSKVKFHFVDELGFKKELREFERALTIEALMKKFKFDIIECPEWGAEGLFLTDKNHCLTTRLHTPLFLVNQLQGQIFSNDSFVKRLEREQCENSISVSSPTIALKNIVESEWNIKVDKVIPNSLNVKEFTNGKLLNFESLGDYVLFLGRLEERKGIKEIIKSLPSFFEENNLFLVFAGSDSKLGKSKASEVISKTSKAFKVLGNARSLEKRSLIKNAKFVLLPSKWENMPYSCLESLALGKAVIGSKNSGFDEIITNEKNGLLVKPSNSNELINACHRLLDNDFRKKIEKKAKKRSLDFDSRIICKKVEDFFEFSIRKFNEGR